jgi:cytochrome P450
LASYRIGRKRLFLASDPDLIEQVLVTDAKHYIKHFATRTYKPVLGNGLVTSEGEFWLRQRRLIQPAFLKARMLSYIPLMAEVTDRMLDRWIPGTSVDTKIEFSALTSAIALRTLFGLDEHGERERFDHHILLAFDLMAARLDLPFQLPDWLPTPANIRLRRTIGELNGMVEGFITAGRGRRPPGRDLLAALIAAQDEDGSYMSDRQLRDEAMTLYLAGHETTALTLAWSWYLISQHPNVEESLVSEWRQVLNGRTPRADDLSSLPYTSAVIAESMRLYPPVYALGREASTDLQLGGYRVKRGYTVLMSPWVSHRDPKYFPDPERFWPERWRDGLATRIPKYAYFPFGGGQRLCVGNNFALMEASIILPAVGQKFRFTLDAGAVIDIKLQMTLLPKHGIPATLQPR